MSRIHNFSAGPSALPLEVLEQAQKEFCDFNNTGASIAEVSHRGGVFLDVINTVEADIRELLSISDEYSILFLQGGAQSQFFAVPMNLALDKRPAAYLDTGHWSRLAIAEAKKFTDVHLIGSSADTQYTGVPKISGWTIPQDASYLHVTPNETIHGVEFYQMPETAKDSPIVADMSSTIMSRPFDVNQYGLIYAGAQKNLGIAGLTIVIIRKDLLKRSQSSLPSILNYDLQASKDSMANTPATFSIYMSGLVLKWLKQQGGLTAIASRNIKKAETFYAYLDSSEMYSNPVDAEYRSRMNIPFFLNNESLNEEFLKAAAANNIIGLKGHRIIGGMRASLYNAVSQDSVDYLIKFMDDFAQQHKHEVSE